MSQAIKTFVVEEHHEAYLVWRYALAEKLIQSVGNTLLHIDEHSDMSAPSLNDSIHHLNGDLEKVKEFTYKELNIASFIVPAIYQRLFDKVYWIRQRHNKASKKPHHLYVRSFTGEGKKLVTGKLSLLKQFSADNERLEETAVSYQFYKQHIEEIGAMKNVLLDIDLDYFSCIQDPLKRELSIEVSKEEYEEFMKSPYHRIRFFDFGRVEAKEVDNRYYYFLNRMNTKYESPLKVDFENITARIEKTAAVLEKKKIHPQLITICRSRYSGYTPSDQWKEIEERVICALENIYGPLAIRHISSLGRVNANVDSFAYAN